MCIRDRAYVLGRDGLAQREARAEHVRERLDLRVARWEAVGLAVGGARDPVRLRFEVQPQKMARDAFRGAFPFHIPVGVGEREERE